MSFSIELPAPAGRRPDAFGVVVRREWYVHSGSWSPRLMLCSGYRWPKLCRWAVAFLERHTSFHGSVATVISQ